MDPQTERSLASEPRGDEPSPTLVVGIGASAGGLGACQRFLEGAPADRGLAFVIVLHLSPDGESRVAEILQKGTSMTVTQVTGNERVEPDHVYVIAPATSLGIRDGALDAGAPEEPHFRARPVDAFFAALAAEREGAAVGIVLSGTGGDGAAGLQAIRAVGGLCLVQDPETAEYAGMPRSAIATGVADAVVAPEEMGEVLLRYAGTPRERPAAKEAEPAAGETAEETAGGLPQVLALLGEHYGVDFRDYKTGMLMRRTQRRIELKRLSGWPAYVDYLKAHPKEIDELYRDLLIGVTSFFRDAEDWALLADEIVPELVGRHRAGSALRVWSAGCATGEEAYGLAMIFLEHFDSPRNAAEGRQKLTVFASDASGQALEVARRGRYPTEIEEQVSEARLQRFFRRSGDGWDVERELRDVITFAAHDLLGDPPFAYLDMVSCRNVLIYLAPDAQERLLELFHFALLPGGILWLGSSETIGRRSDLFEEAASGKQHIYRSIGGRRPGRQYLKRQAAGAAGLQPPRRGGSTADKSKTARSLERMVLERYTSPCVVVDRRLEILYLFGPTGLYLTQPQGEVAGDVLSWVRPELYAKLRAGLAEALEHSRPVTVTGVRLERDAVAVRVEIVIEPVTAGSGGEGLISIVFREVPSASRTSAAPEDGDADAVTGQLKQDLEDARNELRTVVDQLRIASEEHSTSYEELLSLNEEFQSANEELEASKEELQSLNEELTTINSQLEEKNDELRTLTSDLNNLLVSADVATLFLDRDLRIRRFTPACAAVISIGQADVGRPLAGVPMRVRDDTVLADARRVLAEAPSGESAGVPVEPPVLAAEVSTGDDRWFSRRVLPYRTEAGDVDGVCVTYHEITQQKRAAAESEHARRYAEAVIRTSRTPLLVLDMNHRVTSANDAFYATFQIDRGEAEEEGRTLYELADGQWDIPRVRALLDEVLKEGGREVRDFDVDHAFARIGWRSLRLNAQVMPRDDHPDLILVSIEDVTDLRLAEKVAEGRADELTKDDRRKNEFLAMLGHELRNPLAALSHGLEILRGADGGPIGPVREMMERQTRRMTVMLDQLLDVARVISGKFELTRNAADVAEVARAAIESVTPMLEAAQHEVTVILPPEGTVLVQGDEVRLAQVIENLLGNAAKYTKNGGRVELTVEATEDTVEITVRDNGIGLAPDELDHMFDLFTQAPTSLDRAKGGLGLGLPLVRSLVQMHQGEVHASSAGPGQGTEVVVTLPRLRRGRLLASQQDEPPRTQVAPRRILVVDDESDTASALAELLTLKGHPAKAVLDGTAALAAAAELEPELVLIDLGLPGMDGYELARRFRDLYGERVHLVAVTGYSEDRDRLREAGFDGHLLKPTSLDQLLGLIGRLERGT